MAGFAVVRNAQSVARHPGWHAYGLSLLQLKGINNESNETWRQEPREISKMVSAPTPCA